MQQWLPLAPQAMAASNQAAHALLSFRAAEVSGGEGLERFERGVFV